MPWIFGIRFNPDQISKEMERGEWCELREICNQQILCSFLLSRRWIPINPDPFHTSFSKSFIQLFIENGRQTRTFDFLLKGCRLILSIFWLNSFCLTFESLDLFAQVLFVTRSRWIMKRITITSSRLLPLIAEWSAPNRSLSASKSTASAVSDGPVSVTSVFHFFSAIVLFVRNLIPNLITYLCCPFFYLGISERVEYVPGSGRQDLFPEALINLCDFPCQPESIQARLTLASSHLGKNCDRDTYTIQVDTTLEKCVFLFLSWKKKDTEWRR